MWMHYIILMHCENVLLWRPSWFPPSYSLILSPKLMSSLNWFSQERHRVLSLTHREWTQRHKSNGDSRATDQRAESHTQEVHSFPSQSLPPTDVCLNWTLIHGEITSVLKSPPSPPMPHKHRPSCSVTRPKTGTLSPWRLFTSYQLHPFSSGNDSYWCDPLYICYQNREDCLSDVEGDWFSNLLTCCLNHLNQYITNQYDLVVKTKQRLIYRTK